MPRVNLSNQQVAALKAMPDAIFARYGIARNDLAVLQNFGAKLIKRAEARKKKVKVEEQNA